MYERGEKRGLSTVVITLIVILVSIVAIAIIWIAVRNVIQRGSEGIQMGQFTIDASVEVIGINESRNNVSLIITRNPGKGEFTGVIFLFENATDKETVEKHFILYELEARGFELHLNMLGVANLTKLSIYPLYRTSSTEFKMGSKTDEYIFTGIEKFLFRPGGGAICGNNVSEMWEECDNPDWKGISDCSDLGYLSGTLTCNAPGDARECRFDTSQCQGGTPSCTPMTCVSYGYECGTGYLNGTCSGTLNCNNPGCGSQATCPSGTCVCNSGWADCNNDNSCECDLASNYCSGITCTPNSPITAYWVSSTGTATWANCNSTTPLSGTAACSLSTANANAKAGNLVYLRAGTYTITGDNVGINPANTGTSGNSIIFEAYPGETPLLQGDGGSGQPVGFNFNNKDYIVIRGIKFRNFFYSGLIFNGADYNEVDNCEFYSEPPYSPWFGVLLSNGWNQNNPGSTNNWIHNSSFHRLGGDMLRTGDTGFLDQNDNYNTFENNVLYQGAHAPTEDMGKYNVWRNNIIHNEGFYDSGAIYGTAVGGGTNRLVASENLVAKGARVGNYIFVTSSAASSYGIGTITGFSTTSITNDTADYTIGQGTVTFSNGLGYAISASKQVPNPVGVNPGNGKWGARSMSFTGYESGVVYRYLLIEGNRVGYGTMPYDTNGADGIALGSPGTILRYNYIYGAEGPGIIFKEYGGDGYRGSNNRIYSNTIYKNGRSIVGSENPAPAAAITQLIAPGAKRNFIKNNILYENYNDYSYPAFKGIYVGTKSDQIWAANICEATDAALACTNLGNPQFVNADMSNMASRTLPDLSLQSSSPAIDKGTYLTIVDISDTGTGMTLIVNDSRYFQDGTWGSALSDIQPDWIAIGTVGNIVQISSINYATNTITLANSISRNDNDPVWLYKDSTGKRVLYGNAPDAGAYEYV